MSFLFSVLASDALVPRPNCWPFATPSAVPTKGGLNRDTNSVLDLNLSFTLQSLSGYSSLCLIIFTIFYKFSCCWNVCDFCMASFVLSKVVGTEQLFFPAPNKRRNPTARPEPLVKLTTVDPGVKLKFFGSYRTHDLAGTQQEQLKKS